MCGAQTTEQRKNTNPDTSTTNNMTKYFRDQTRRKGTKNQQQLEYEEMDERMTGIVTQEHISKPVLTQTEYKQENSNEENQQELIPEYTRFESIMRKQQAQVTLEVYERQPTTPEQNRTMQSPETRYTKEKWDIDNLSHN